MSTTDSGRTHRRRSTRRVRVAALGIAALVLSGCINIRGDEMIGIQFGVPSVYVTIRRHASRDVVYVSSGSSDYERGSKASGVLRTASDWLDLNGFARDRWIAATAPDQYADLGAAVRDVDGRARCLNVQAKAGWGNVGYNWSYRDFDDRTACYWGADPAPDIP